MATQKQFNLLDVATVSGSRVSKFDGSKQYVATADIDFNQITGGEEVTHDDRPSRADLVMSQNDVLFAKMKNTVKVIAGSSEVEDKIFSTGFYILTPKENVGKKYLYFYLLGDDFNHQKNLYSSGATMAAIGNEGLKRIKISLPVDNEGKPNIKEQERIVALLEEAEELKRKRAEADQKMATVIPALFNQMFGDPIQNDRKWPLARIGSFTKIVTGNTPPRANKEFYGSEVEWIKSDNILESQIHPTKSKEYLSDLGEKKGRTTNENAILMTCIAGSLNTIGNVCLTDRHVAFNQQINAIEVIDGTNPLFLYALLKNSKKQLHRSASIVLKHIINKTSLENVEVIRPPFTLQNEFAEKVKDILAFEDKQKRSTANINGLFSSLLAGAFASK